MFTLEQKVKIAEAGCKDLGYNILGAYTSKAHFFLDALYEYAEMYPDYRLVLICGPDRADLYGKYCVPFGEDYELQDENDIGKFEILYCTDRGDKEVSGTKVREAIRNGDKDAFLEMTGYSDKMWNLCVKFAKQNGVLGESTIVKDKNMLTEDKAKIIPAGEIWQGDLLFTKGDIKNYTDDNGQKYIYFKPNTLVYALPVGSDGAKKALASDIGIVFHTRYKGSSVQTVKQSNDASTDELNGIPEWAFVLDARLPNLSGVQTLSDQEANDIEDSLYDLHSLCSEIVNDADYDLLVNNTDFINFYIMTLQNNKVDKSELIDPETFVEELHKWVTGKMRKEYQGLEKLKTKAGRDKKRISIDNKSKDLHTIIETNEPLLHKIAEALYIAADVKNKFITKLNSVNKWVNKVETTFGMKDTNSEGFMVSDVDGNFVKLVDRSAFSYFNRSPDVIKGFDARRGSTNESMNFASYLKSLES